MKSVVRAIDGNDKSASGNGYKMRRVWDIKTIAVLIGALLGGASTGVGVKFYTTNEVNQTPARIEILTERMNAYISGHAREESLENQLVEQKLMSIKEDLDELKERSKAVNSKLEYLTRLVKNGNSN